MKDKEITFDWNKHQSLPAVEILPLVVLLHQFNRRRAQLGENGRHIVIGPQRVRQEKPIFLGNTAVTARAVHNNIERRVDRNPGVAVGVKVPQIFDGREVLESSVGDLQIGVLASSCVTEIMGQEFVPQAIA